MNDYLFLTLQFLTSFDFFALDVEYETHINHLPIQLPNGEDSSTALQMVAVGNDTQVPFEIKEISVDDQIKTVLIINTSKFNYESFKERINDFSQIEFCDSTWYYNNMVPLRTVGENKSNLLFTPNENVVLDIVDQNTLFDNDSRKNTIDHEKIQSSESEQTNKLYLDLTVRGMSTFPKPSEPMLPRNCRRSLCRALTRAHASRTSSRAPRTRSAQHEDAIRTSVG